jgi:hypothetical protein
MSYELELLRPALREGLADVLKETGTASIPIQRVMRGALLRISARIVEVALSSTVTNGSTY